MGDTEQYIRQQKYIVTSETGNLIIISTDDVGAISQEARENLSELLVFFSGLFRTITSIKKNDSNEYYSIYDTTVINTILQRSGYFIKLNAEKTAYNINSIGSDIALDVLNVITGINKVNFNSNNVSMIRTTINESIKNKNVGKTGSLLFICEVLMGVISINCILFNIQFTNLEEAIVFNKLLNTRTNDLYASLIRIDTSDVLLTDEIQKNSRLTVTNLKNLSKKTIVKNAKDTVIDETLSTINQLEKNNNLRLNIEKSIYQFISTTDISKYIGRYNSTAYTINNYDFFNEIRELLTDN